MHIWKVRLMPDSLILFWGQFLILPFLKLHSSPNFHLIHPNFIECIIIIEAVTFWAIGQNLQKLWHFEIFPKQDHLLL